VVLGQWHGLSLPVLLGLLVRSALSFLLSRPSEAESSLLFHRKGRPPSSSATQAALVLQPAEQVRCSSARGRRPGGLILRLQRVRKGVIDAVECGSGIGLGRSSLRSATRNPFTIGHAADLPLYLAQSFAA